MRLLKIFRRYWKIRGPRWPPSLPTSRLIRNTQKKHEISYIKTFPQNLFGSQKCGNGSQDKETLQLAVCNCESHIIRGPSNCTRYGWAMCNFPWSMSPTGTFEGWQWMVTVSAGGRWYGHWKAISRSFHNLTLWLHSFWSSTLMDGFPRQNLWWYATQTSDIGHPPEPHSWRCLWFWSLSHWGNSPEV